MIQKPYQLKACFMLIATLTFGTLLIRLSDTNLSTVWQALTHITNTTLVILACWLVHAWLKLHPPANWPASAVATLSLIAGMLISMAMGYIIVLSVPPRFLFSDMLLRSFWPDLFKRLVGSFFLSMICYMIYNYLFTRNILQNTQLENEQLKQARLRAQLIALQQQLSPHFLFNSLSTLKTIATDTETKNFVLQLSHVYRYLLAGSERQITTLAEELKFVRAYLYIQEQRFESALQVSLNVPDSYVDHLLPPLSVQLLIENAIKHNAFSPDEPLHVDIRVNDNDDMVVSNNYRPKKKTEESTGLGLQNIRERFQLLFNKSIIVQQLPDTFTVMLPLTTNEDHHH